MYVSDMKSVHSNESTRRRTEEANGHRDALADECREVRHARADCVTTRTRTDTGGGVEEVEDELRRCVRIVVWRA